MSESLDMLNERLFANYVGWENDVLNTIGQSVKKVGELSPEDIKQINNIMTAQTDYNKVMEELAKASGKSVEDIVTLYAQDLKSVHLLSRAAFTYRGAKFIENDNRLISIIRANARATAGEMFNLTNTKALGCTIGGKFVPLEQTMEQAIGKATLQVQTAATDFNTAMAGALKEIGGSGVQVNYGSGVTRRLDTVVRQNMLYGAKNMYKEYNDLIGKELGCDGIEIDYHHDCRPSHEFMQGKQYAKGKTVVINGEKYLSADEADPTSPDGLSANEALNDYGCRHFATDIILGISEPAIDKDDLERMKAQDKQQIDVDGKSKTGYF